MHKILGSCLSATVLLSGCGATTGLGGSSSGTGSEVATSTVSGAMNNSGGGTVAQNNLPKYKPSTFERLINFFDPVKSAFAMTFSCTGGSLNPTYSGPGTYTFTPRSCTITWANGRTGSSTWDSTFSLVYGASCDSTHPFPSNNTGANCTVTRTTGASGNTRTVTGPLGNTYAILHNTNGAGTGWDTTVTPAPNNNGMVITCGASGCAGVGGSHSLVINGSHLTGTLDGVEVWDHTVSTDASGLTVTGSGTSRVVNGTVTVQHNLAKFTSTATFTNVTYGSANCCFPTSGSVATTLKTGGSETLTFTSTCGEATLTLPNATSSSAYTLHHCLYGRG